MPRLCKIFDTHKREQDFLPDQENQHHHFLEDTQPPVPTPNTAPTSFDHRHHFFQDNQTTVSPLQPDPTSFIPLENENVPSVVINDKKDITVPLMIPIPPTARNVPPSSRPRRNVGSYKDGPAKIHRPPITGESYKLAYNIAAPI